MKTSQLKWKCDEEKHAFNSWANINNHYRKCVCDTVYWSIKMIDKTAWALVSRWWSKVKKWKTQMLTQQKSLQTSDFFFRKLLETPQTLQLGYRLSTTWLDWWASDLYCNALTIAVKVLCYFPLAVFMQSADRIPARYDSVQIIKAAVTFSASLRAQNRMNRTGSDWLERCRAEWRHQLQKAVKMRRRCAHCLKVRLLIVHRQSCSLCKLCTGLGGIV